jgi:hypothetical protein
MVNGGFRFTVQRSPFGFLTSDATSIVRRIQPLRAHRASLSSPHYSSDEAISDGLITNGILKRGNHRTVSTEVTEVCGPPFRRSPFTVRSSKFWEMIVRFRAKSRKGCDGVGLLTDGQSF